MGTPPPAGAPARLLVIPFSHYCEKARWALDLYRVPFVEERFLPGQHTAAVRAALSGARLDGAADAAGSALSTPVLVLEDGTVLQDSSSIVAWASRVHGENALYPHPDVAAAERRFHDGLGIWTRRLAYGFCFGTPALLRRLIADNVSGTKAQIARAATLVAGPLIARYGALSAADETALIASIDRELDEVDATLQQHSHVVGAAFTAADLAFACALAPALLVQPHEGCTAVYPPLDVVPTRYRTLAQAWRARPAGRHALAMFATRLSAKPSKGRGFKPSPPGPGL